VRPRPTKCSSGHPFADSVLDPFGKPVDLVRRQGGRYREHVPITFILLSAARS
jgi:hypothetical protein